MPTQLEKLEGHASHLLDSFIRLREQYSLLEPMLFDEEVPTLRGSGKQARGFLTLRYSLFLSCSQDIAKLSFDRDARSPSIKTLIEALDDQQLTSQLRERFAVWRLPPIEEESDPEIIAALERLELSEQDERRAQFDRILASGRASWDGFKESEYMQGFLTIRNKVTAHTEVRHVADKYSPVDLGELGVKWGDLGRAITEMQKLVDALGLLIRNAGFAWEMLDEQLSKSAKAFWLPTD